MKSRVLLGWMVLCLAACAQAVETESEDEEFGSLTLSLTGVDSAGVTYRLRNATFEIYGYPELGYPGPLPWPFPAGTGAVMGGSGGSNSNYYYEQVSTEDDVDAQFIQLHLVPGYYNITLLNGDWYLERTVNGVTERVAQAVLLSPIYQGAYVYDGGLSQVFYRFGVDGQAIDFRSGDLQIGIEIEKPGEHCAGGGFAGFGFAGFGFPGGRGGVDCGAAGAGGAAGAAGDGSAGAAGDGSAGAAGDGSAGASGGSGGAGGG